RGRRRVAREGADGGIGVVEVGLVGPRRPVLRRKGVFGSPRIALRHPILRGFATLRIARDSTLVSVLPDAPGEISAPRPTRPVTTAAGALGRTPRSQRSRRAHDSPGRCPAWAPHRATRAARARS